ncbi:hypothetical protein JKF63_06514 [Porcisia hertigi]|uniref:NTF2 domain-containing protein n=1 Tax=Porcisia hertigi TaxID=2761500 RepID=A0A836IXK1_9TRYP|nr:hypothetical protein JKF63_06514 [Porcisia hertigi]
MAITTSDTRLQSIGASFAVQYYTALVKNPEALASLYTPSAHVVHRLKKANGTAEISSLLTFFTTEGLSGVKLEDVVSAPTTSGSVKVTVKGEFVGATKTQSFTQEVILRELEKNTYGITSDQLSCFTAQPTAGGAEAPEEKAAAENTTAAAVPVVEERPAKSPAAVAKSADSQDPAAAAPSDAPTADTAAATSAPTETAAEPVPATPKKPASFAEALRLKKVGGGPVSVSASVRAPADKVKSAEDKKAKKVSSEVKKDTKAATPSAATAKSRVVKKLPSASTPVLYDIILKDLAESITEEEVRAVVEPVAGVKLVSLVKRETRRLSKEAASKTITFAFVQLKRPSNASATYVKDVLAKLTELKKEMRFEEVQEKKPLSPGLRNLRVAGAAVSKRTAKA